MKTKKMSFRIVTALLAVCMMLPLMPATGNVASAAGETTVNFATNAVSSLGEATYDKLGTLGWSLDAENSSTAVTGHNKTFLSASNYVQACFPSVGDKISFKFTTATAGYFNVDAVINPLVPAQGIYGDVLIDGVYVGLVEFFNTNSTAPDREIGLTKLSAGEHTLTIRRSNPTGAFLIQLKQLILTPVEKSEQTIKFTYGRDGWNFPTTSEFLNDAGWYMDSPATSSGVINDGWTRSTVDYARLGFPAKEDTITLKIKTLISGYYSANILISKYGTSASTNGIIGDVTLDGVSLGNFDSTTTDYADVLVATQYKLGSIYLEEGEHTLKIKRLNETGGKILFLNAISFTPSENTISTNEVFGNKYAYVKKSATGGYDVTFIGGLHKLTGYQTAGFKVLSGENEVADATTQVAYKSIIVSGDKLSKTPADYGVENDGYIFMAEAKGLAAGTYTVVPYVIDADDNVIEHNVTLTLTISE